MKRNALALELADSNEESAESSADFVVVGQAPIFNMFNIQLWIQTIDNCRRLLPSGYGSERLH